jgi:hypothetical protein
MSALGSKAAQMSGAQCPLRSKNQRSDSFPPPALCERGHCCLARCGIAVRRRAIFAPQPVQRLQHFDRNRERGSGIFLSII